MQASRPLAAAAICIAAVVAFLLSPAGAALAAPKLIASFISNPTDSVTEFRPRIAGDVVVWQRGTGNGSEVMRWNGFVGVNLTSNGVADENPETDGVHIIWQQRTGAVHDLAVHDLVTRTTTLLASSGDEVSPVISGYYVAWIERVDADGEVFIDPGPIGAQLTGNSLVESSLAFSGSNLVWSEGDDLRQTPDTSDDDHDVAVWNAEIGGLFILAGNPTDDIRPVIAGNTIVWQAGADGSGDIWIGDAFGTTSLLYDGPDERNPDTDGARVVWEHFDGLDRELFLIDLASPNSVVQLTTDGTDDVTPQIDGANIVWEKKVTPGDSEIWFSWNGDAPEPLLKSRDNGRDDVRPRLDGDHFVYESCANLGQPNELCDVVLAPEPRATLLVAVTLATLSLLASRSARRAQVLAGIPKRR
jgi:hypothetical protein